MVVYILRREVSEWIRVQSRSENDSFEDFVIFEGENESFKK